MTESSIERKRLEIGPGFDPNSPPAVTKLMTAVENEYGTGWLLQSFDAHKNEVSLERRSAVMQVTQDHSQDFRVALGIGVNASDGDKIATRFEADPRFTGYVLTAFNPHLGEAILSQLTPGERLCREAVATVFAVKPWDIHVSTRPDGGFQCNLPGSKYVRSRHYDKLLEVAVDRVGKLGWYIDVDTRTMTVDFIPAEQPTFPDTIGYPFELDDGDPTDPDYLFRIPVGLKLGAPGCPNEIQYWDLSGTGGGIAQGTAGSGKSVTLNQVLYGLKRRNWELVVATASHKVVDFLWLKDLVRDNGFGCQGVASAVAALAEVYSLKDERSALLAEYGVPKWQDLPADVRPPLVIVLMDEVTALFTKVQVPAYPKIDGEEHPRVTEAKQTNLEIAELKYYVNKIPAELRFLGVRLLIATQQGQSNTGLEPTMKINLPGRWMLGVGADEQQRRHALKNPNIAPQIPDNIKYDEAMGRGVGVVEFEGQAPAVVKSFYGSDTEYRERLLASGARQTMIPEPSQVIINRHVFQLDGSSEPGFGFVPQRCEPWEVDPETGEPLTGFARANAARMEATRQAGAGG